MKGHKKQKCSILETLTLSDGSVYTGNVYDSKPSGKGKVFYSTTHYYEGYFLNGEKSGFGKETNLSGVTYEGDWLSNKYHGFGILQTRGFTFKGHFYMGRYHGKGTLLKNNNVSYTGEWANGIKHGYGILNTGSAKFEGNFYYNLRHGHGVEIDSSGNTYSGSWRSGNRHGEGTYTTSEYSYTGGWINNKRHGKGKEISKIFGVYVGNWKRGFKHNCGKQSYLNGSVYTGGWSYGKRTGHGTMKYCDDTSYEGFWLDNEYNGRGKLDLGPEGIYEGEWTHAERDGIFKETRGDVVLYGPWLCDLRHGTFTRTENSIETKELYLWNTKTDFKNLKAAKKSVRNVLKKKDFLAAEEILNFYPKLIKWPLFEKYDKKGVLLHMLDKEKVSRLFIKNAYKLFKEERYSFVERLFNLCSEDVRECNNDSILFDCVTNDFTSNPWVVRDQGYSSNTKTKLLEGLHLGEYGRCPPKNPFTRQVLTENSGKQLSKTPKLARKTYKKFIKSIKGQTNVEELAFQFDLQDFETELKNARESQDRDTIMRLMKERNTFIKRYRSESRDFEH